jgi:chemotaxis protein CheX
MSTRRRRMTSANQVSGAISNEELAQSITTSVKQIFSTMIFMDDIVEEEFSDEADTRFNCSISALVGLGGSCPGMVGVHIPEDFAKEVTAAMLGMEPDEVEGDSDIHDAVGEVANMLAGEMKMVLSNKGADVCISTPTIISGKEYVIDVLADNGAISVPFTRGVHRFLGTLQLDPA